MNAGAPAHRTAGDDQGTATPRSLTAKARILITTVGNLHEFWGPFAFEETKCSFSAAIVRNAWTRRTRTLEKCLTTHKRKMIRAAWNSASFGVAA